MKVLFYFFFCALLFAACQSKDGKRNIEDFYFPLEALQHKGVVYEYQPVQPDSIAPYYWYYRTIQQQPDSPLMLVGVYYDINFEQQQLVREERVNNGMLVEEVVLYLADTSGTPQQISAEILAANAFPFEVKDSSGVFLYKVQWNSPIESSGTTTLIRNRRFWGDTTFVFQGEPLPCVRFLVREIIENEQEGFLEIELEGEEWYAKNLGLVFTRRRAVASPFEQTYALRDTFAITELEERFRQQQVE